MKINRNIPPEIKPVTHLEVPRPTIYHLSNGIPVYDIDMGTQAVVKIEIVFFAGRPFEEKRLASRATASLLREGSAKYSAAEIATKFDFYGGSLTIPTSLDTSNILVYSLRKHLDKLLPIVADMLMAPAFVQKELDAYIARSKRRLQEDLANNEAVAFRTFTEMIFGTDHPYGYNSQRETYESLRTEDLLRHFTDNYSAGNCMIFISGKTGEIFRHKLEKYFGTLPRGLRRQADIQPAKTEPIKHSIQISESPQSSILVGRALFNRHHPDYNGMYVLNTILGGYFGSRLMGNIREKNGFTYNIYSTHEAFLYDGYFYIGTETGNEFVSSTLCEVYRELERLQSELVSEEELSMVKNYLLGNLLTYLDGPFNIAEVVKTFTVEGLPLSAFESLVQTIRNIDAETIRELARRYFQRDQMWEVVVH